MNKIAHSTFTLILALLCLQVSAQGYYQSQDQKFKKYFVGAGYGIGDAYWFSNMGSTELYDDKGEIIRSGDMRFNANNNTRILNLEIAAPVYKFRVGLGISFEDFYLDKLSIESNTATANGRVVIFSEKFRFERFYAHVELPFKYDTDKPYSFSMKANVGYFGVSEIDHIKFFGEEHSSRTFFTTLGFIADYKLYSHSYFFINPTFEYKYFGNSPLDSPSEINHNIITFSAIIGLRFDVSREH